MSGNGWFRRLTLGVCLLAGGIRAMHAHDLWLQPSTFFAARGQELTASLELGEHGKPEESKPLHRGDIVHFGLFGGRRPTQDLLHRLPKEGDAPNVPVRLEGASALLAMERAPKRLDQGATEFERYLTEEGQTDAIAHRAQSGQTDQPGRERYRRYLKTLVQDAEHPNAPAVLYRRRIGQRLEILLEKNPGRLRPGQPVRVRVLFENRPLAGVRVSALHRAQPDQPGTDRTFTATTDRIGRATFPPFDESGPWMVRLVHLRPVAVVPPTPGAEDVSWESFWASYTFGVRLLPPVPLPSAPANPIPRRED